MRRWHHQLTHLHIHIDWSRNVSWKFAKLQKYHNFLIFQSIFIRFSLFCSQIFTLSSEIKLILFWISSLINETWQSWSNSLRLTWFLFQMQSFLTPLTNFSLSLHSEPNFLARSVMFSFVCESNVGFSIWQFTNTQMWLLICQKKERFYFILYHPTNLHKMQIMRLSNYWAAMQWQ